MKSRTPGLLVTLAAAAAVTMLVDGGGVRVAPARGATHVQGDGPLAWQILTLPPAAGAHPASFGEPGITVGPHRVLVVDAARANAGYPTWWISSDDGSHWGSGQDFDTTGAMTGDADAAFGPDGYLYALNLAFQNPPQQPTNPTILVYSSPDRRHWAGPATFPPPHGADQPDRPWLVPDPYRPGRVLVTNSEGAGDVVAWVSADHAHTFSGPTLVTGVDHAGSIELTSRPLFDPANHDRVLMLYEASAADVAPPASQAPLRDFPLTQLWLAESDDAGMSWSNRLVLDITEAFGPEATGGSLGHVLPASATDVSGTLYAAFSLRLGNSTQTHVFLIHSTDHGRQWSTPVRVDSEPLRSNVMPSLAAGASGRVDVSWYGSQSADFTDPDSRWVEMFAQSVDALAAQPTFTGGAVSAVTHVGSIDASGNPGSSQYDWDLRDFQGLAIDACGMAHVAWTDDVGKGSTAAARQISGPSLLPGLRC
ncbi:MAG: sialidase family protein [Actinomycetota bacterium]